MKARGRWYSCPLAAGARALPSVGLTDPEDSRQMLPIVVIEAALLAAQLLASRNED